MRVNTGSGGEGGEGGFEGEGVGVKPGQESGFAEDTGVGELAGVYMGVWGRCQIVLRREPRVIGGFDEAPVVCIS